MKHLFSRRSLVVLGAFVACIILMVLLATRPSADLKAWKEAMSVRGERFSLTEIAPPFSPAAVDWELGFSNAVRQLAKGPHAPGLLLLMNTNADGSAPLVWQRADPFGSTTPVGIWTGFSEQIKSNEAVFGEIRKLLAARPSGSVYDPSGPLGNRNRINWIARRSAAQNLSAATVCALHQGRLDEGLAQLDTLMDLAEAGDPGGALVDQMIQTAIFGLALNLTWEACHAPGWNEARLVALQRRWQGVNLITNFCRVVEVERAFGLACFDYARTNRAGISGLAGSPGTATQPLSDRLRDAALSVLWRGSWSEKDEFLFLRSTQPLIEGMRSAQTNAVYAAFDARVRESRAILDAETQGALGKQRHAISMMVAPNWEKAFLVAWKHESFRRVAICALAIKRHQLRHGNLPDNLKALVPDFLPGELPDPMSGQPLHYRRLPDGLFLLYSVGENGQDDGGSGDDIYWPRVAPSGER